LDLEGIRVLDLTRLLPGAFCTMLLADLGADVVKVEEPGAGDYMRWYPPLVDGLSAGFRALNVNKRSLTLNLKTDDGKRVFKALAARADVVVEGNRPGVMARLGLGWDVLHELNPRLVMCSITGYGQDGPFAQRAGHDLNYMAIAGALILNGPPGGAPHPLAVQVADIGAGGVGAAAAILGALVGVLRGGEGRRLDVSMTDGATGWMARDLAELAAGGEERRPGLTRLTGAFPCYRVYTCADGRFLSVSALEPKFWEQLCEALGRPDLLPLHVASDPAAHATLEAVFAEKTRDEWARILEGKDVCVEPVLEASEVAAHPQIAHRGLLDREARLPPPGLGEHSGEVLAEVGVDAAELERLRAAGVV
jgi:alpha-methylacyl-CoA racemase